VTDSQPAAPAAVLAIDGGNSKTDVALVAADGTVLAAARGPGASVNTGQLAGWLDELDRLIARTARGAGLDPAGPLAERTAAYLAGIDLPAEERQLAELLGGRGWSTGTQVGNDILAVLRAGTTRPWGVAVNCGAGINCAGIGRDGTSTGFLALGRLTGDFGGGLDLGTEMMWWAMRAEDGRGPATGLLQAVAAHFGRPTVREVAIAFHLGELTEQDLSRLTPVLFRLSDAGDEVAGSLVDHLAAEVSTMALVAMRRLKLTTLDTEVVLGGGMLTAHNDRLTTGIRHRIHQEAPTARIGILDVPPIVGAALLGLDHLNADPAAAQRIRATYPRLAAD
jgi:N-acetylglucosamine kinase-like BadF-type ATPase